MKTNFLLNAHKSILCFALVLTALTISSCKKSDPIITSQVDLAEIDPLILAKIKGMGFNTDGIREFGDFYVIEDDIMISKNPLLPSKTSHRQSGSNGKTSQANTDNLVNGNYSQNVNISLEASIYANPWYEAIRTAVTVWNSNPNCNVKLNLIFTSLQDYSLDPTNIDIVIKGDNGLLPYNVAALAEFPNSSGRPGSLILINKDFKNPYNNTYINDGQVVWNVIHEIGHCLGLRHTNWYLINEGITNYGANDIPNTPSSYQGDANSVMNGGTALSSYMSNIFPLLPSNYDAIAISTLYPINANSSVIPYISSNKNFYTSGEDYFIMSYLEQGLSYHWRVVGINGTIYDQTIGTFSSEKTPGIGFPNAGEYQIRCTISGGKYTVPVTATKNIIVH